MELIYAVMHGQSYALQSEKGGLRLLKVGYSVDPGYGFESPQRDNEWIREHCGLRVFRKYLCFGEDSCVAVFESIGDTTLKDGFLWCTPDQLPPEPVLLMTRNGRHSKTAPWFGRDYLSWAVEVLTERGWRIQGQIEQIKNAYVSSIFRIPTTGGGMYLKIAASVYVNSEAVSQRLAAFMGGFPECVAVSPDGMASITKEMPGADCAGGSPGQYRRWLEAWGKKQAATACGDFGDLADLTPQKLLADLSGFPARVSRVYENTGRPMPAGLEQRLPQVRADLERLCQYPIPNALCHGDIRPGNVRITDRGEWLYDWGLAVVCHPFYDALHFLHVVRRQLTREQRGGIIEAYLNNWTGFCGRPMLLEAFSAAERCMSFIMLSADCRWVEEILAACGGPAMEGTIDSWLLSRRLTYFDRVLRSFIGEGGKC